MSLFKEIEPFLEAIFEDLVNTQIKNTKYNGVHDFSKIKARRNTELGRGMFAKVSTSNDPHVVRKQSTSAIGASAPKEADGFDAYVDLMVEYGVMDNIHFPKVYDGRRVTDANGEVKREYSIERLFPMDSLSPEEWDAMVNVNLRVAANSPAKFCDLLWDAVADDEFRHDYILSDSLNEACVALAKMSRTAGFNLDIHPGNVMVRKTAHGAQPVFSDPFSTKKRFN